MISYSSRLRRLERASQPSCERHIGVIVTEGAPEPDLNCARCGAVQPLLIIPRKLSTEEWAARDWATERDGRKWQEMAGKQPT